jgi:hypothetical protein
MTKADRERIKAKAMSLKAEKAADRCVPGRGETGIDEELPAILQGSGGAATCAQQTLVACGGVAGAAPAEKQRTPPRLPDGSRFDVGYDATAVRWIGTLTIPGVPVFTAGAGGVYGLLAALDRQYRKYLKRLAAAEEAG